MRTRNASDSQYLASILLVLGLVFVAVSAQNATEPEGLSEDDDDSAIDEGMEPFYEMTSNFLDVLQPEDKGNILAELGIDGMSVYLFGCIITSVCNCILARIVTV